MLYTFSYSFCSSLSDEASIFEGVVDFHNTVRQSKVQQELFLPQLGLSNMHSIIIRL